MKILLFPLFFLITSCTSFKEVISSRGDRFKDRHEYISIMQGATSDFETIINFISPKMATYQFKVLDEKGRDITFKAKVLKTHSRKYSPWQVVEVKVSNLIPNIRYQFYVDLKVGKHIDSDSRYFQTLNSKKENYKLLVASCMADSFQKIGDKAWTTVDELNLDAFFLIGDIVYADYRNGRYLGIPAPDMRHIWSRYIDSRFNLKLYQLKNLKPVFATWDDHDLGINNGNKDFDKLIQVKKVFRGFFPILNNDIVQKGKGLGFKIQLAHHNFFFLDNRSFRDSSKNKSGSHLGKRQLNWLLENLKNGNSINWLIQGDQFFGGYHKHESFEGNHPVKFEQFLSKLKNTNNKFVFVSGDRHLYELMKISPEKVGHTSYEITTSGFHAKLFPKVGSKTQNNRRLSIIDNEYNSVILNLSSSEIHVQAINENGKKIDSKKLDLN